MKIYRGDLTRFEDRTTQRRLESDEYVLEQVEFLGSHGFLPAVDSESPPTMEQMRQTLESQDVLNRLNSSHPDEAMVPDGWVDPENTSGTIFRIGKVEKGFVVSANLGEQYSDTRQFMKGVAAATREQRIVDHMTTGELGQPGGWMRRR